jgi:hypothetical protein
MKGKSFTASLRNGNTKKEKITIKMEQYFKT